MWLWTALCDGFVLEWAPGLMGCNWDPRHVHLELSDHIISVKNRLSILIDLWKDTKIIKIGTLWTALVDMFLSWIGLQGSLIELGAQIGHLESAVKQ